MKVAILGYGPAGLIAAHTLINEGMLSNDVHIIGAGGKSIIGGAQYLHEPILVDRDPDGEITFLKIGDRDGYAKKVYDDVEADVSWDHYEGVVPAWSLRDCYDILWDAFEDKLLHDTLDWASVNALISTKRYEMIFSSIPMHALCCPHVPHEFSKVGIKLAKAGPLWVDNTVMYSGREEDQWYRTSCIFGEAWSEFGADSSGAVVYDESDGAMKVADIHTGFKPLGTDCDCLPEVTRIGRFGLWDRKILLHHVPHQVRAALDKRMVIG
jgi:hypothetical protein